MKTYHCEGCGNLVFFENVSCLKCGHALGFLPGCGELGAFEIAENGALRLLASRPDNRLYRQCLNGRLHQICNWMAPLDDPNPFCVSCRLDVVIPNLAVPGNLERWWRLELAKRRIVYSILDLRLPLDGAPAEARPALRFSFLGDMPGQPPIMTGHENGVITINIAEADDDEREHRRVSLHEPYRTLLGHLRHEIGHYYWDRLISRSPWLDRWRALFGDENRPYAAALQSYYLQGPPLDWQARHVSAYAGAHAWEDWAETWAHYLHMIDTLETAAGFGLTLRPRHPADKPMTVDTESIGGLEGSFDAMMEQWLPVVYMLNSLNRGMGLQDLYPFAPSNLAVEKLRFVHEVVQTTRRNIRAEQSSKGTSSLPQGLTTTSRCLDPYQVQSMGGHQVLQEISA